MKKLKVIELKTKHLRLVPLTLEQLEERAQQAGTDGQMASALREMVDGCASHPKAWLWYTSWQILLRTDGTYIGSFCFKGGPAEGCVEIGYGLDEPYRNQGYMTEAVGAAVSWAFGKDVYFVLAETDMDNEASARVLQKNGFTMLDEGNEGPRWVKEKPRTNWMSIYMCLGLCVGLSLGSATDNTAIGLSMGLALGLCLGLAIGAGLDAQEKAAREKYRKLLKKPQN